MRIKRNAVSAAAALLIWSSTLTAEDKNTGNKASFQRMYIDYLTSEGYKPEVDPDGDVTFKREGKNYFINVLPADPNYFRLVLPNVWKIESPAERTKVLIAMDRTNGACKSAKVFATSHSYVWAVVEVFVEKPDDFKKVFPRAISALDYGFTTFMSEMRPR